MLNPLRMSAGKDLECYICVSGVQMKKYSCSAFMVMFLLDVHPAVFLTASPRPFLADNVIKGGQEKRAKFNLTRRSDCLVPAEQKIRDTS